MPWPLYQRFANNPPTSIFWQDWGLSTSNAKLSLAKNLGQALSCQNIYGRVYWPLLEWLVGHGIAGCVSITGIYLSFSIFH